MVPKSVSGFSIHNSLFFHVSTKQVNPGQGNSQHKYSPLHETFITKQEDARQHSIFSLFSSFQDNDKTNRIRLNKVFKATHSRREADKLISSGRVFVNGERINSKGGCYVIPYQDVISLDGVIIKGWEDMNAVDSIDEGNASSTDYFHPIEGVEETKSLTKSHFEYIKYYKPVGITCTTDLKVKDNIIDSIHRHGYNSPHRIYPVGRLDKDTSGMHEIKINFIFFASSSMSHIPYVWCKV